MEQLEHLYQYVSHVRQEALQALQVWFVADTSSKKKFASQISQKVVDEHYLQSLK